MFLAIKSSWPHCQVTAASLVLSDQAHPMDMQLWNNSNNRRLIACRFAHSLIPFLVTMLSRRSIRQTPTGKVLSFPVSSPQLSDSLRALPYFSCRNLGVMSHACRNTTPNTSRRASHPARHLLICGGPLQCRWDAADILANILHIKHEVTWRALHMNHRRSNHSESFFLQ